jgi:recombination protein RecT
MSEITKANRKEITAFFDQPAIKQRFESMLGKNAPQFITSILQVVNSNGNLATADPVTIYTAAATAATLNLPINNNLGFAYIVPYKTKQKDGSYKEVAQFQLGYKGFIQLAIRSGEFARISSTPVYEGQLVKEDPLEGFEFDWTNKQSDTIIGYAAYFRLNSGFVATLYMTKSDIDAHGKRYSKTYGFSNSVWKQDFDGMARKTVLKLLLSKYAPLSVEMQRAVTVDQAVVKDLDTMEVEYVDNEPESQEVMEDNRAELMIADCKTVEELEALATELPPFYADEIAVKKAELTKGSKK